jgi:hypothetical protein
MDGSGRGEADDTLAVETTEDSEDVTLVEGGDAVRYVGGWKRAEGGDAEDEHRSEPMYETTTLERWVMMQSADAAARAVVDHVTDTLEIDGLSGGISDDPWRVTVEAHGRVDHDGAVVSEPPVEFDALVAATPPTVAVTYQFAGQTYHRDVPVYASVGWSRLD